jgi:uncharacterized protein (DUF849 family)
MNDLPYKVVVIVKNAEGFAQSCLRYLTMTDLPVERLIVACTTKAVAAKVTDALAMTCYRDAEIIVPADATNHFNGDGNIAFISQEVRELGVLLESGCDESVLVTLDGFLQKAFLNLAQSRSKCFSICNATEAVQMKYTVSRQSDKAHYDLCGSANGEHPQVAAGALLVYRYIRSI